jgi:CheY-like chemotaxis protein
MAETAKEAVAELRTQAFDCVIIDLTSPQSLAMELLEFMEKEKMESPPNIIIYTASAISARQEEQLKRVSEKIVVKRARSFERLLDEVTLNLHRDELQMSMPKRQMIKAVRRREQVFEGRKILLVDDDIRNIFALTSALEQKGATILVGRNGQEALDKLDQDPEIDLVLMDIMMPEMDGYEATRQIRKQKRFAKLPIIAVTAKAMKDDQEKCMEAGTDDYVSKPVDLEKLLSLIRVWIPSTVTQ